MSEFMAHALQAEIDRTDAAIDALVPAMGPPATLRLTAKVVEGKLNPAYLPFFADPALMLSSWWRATAAS